METCDRCGNDFPFEEMRHGLDPYVSEVHGESEAEEVCLCADCWQSRAEDV